MFQDTSNTSRSVAVLTHQRLFLEQTQACWHTAIQTKRAPGTVSWHDSTHAFHTREEIFLLLNTKERTDAKFHVMFVPDSVAITRSHHFSLAFFYGWSCGWSPDGMGLL